MIKSWLDASMREIIRATSSEFAIGGSAAGISMFSPEISGSLAPELIRFDEQDRDIPYTKYENPPTRMCEVLHIQQKKLPAPGGPIT